MKLQQINIYLTTVKELLKNKMIFYGILGILCFSCKAQEINSEKLFKIKSTHKINNQIIYNILEKLEEKKDLFSNKSDCIYLDIKKNEQVDFTILAAHLTLLDCQVLSYNSKKRLKGYFHFKDKIVFLYGNIDKSLFIKNGVIVKNLMKSSYTVDKNHPPISLHLNIIEFHLKNNILIKQQIQHY